MKSAIVTGANGFVGSNLVEKLSKNGVQVYAFVRDKRESKRLIDCNNITIIECKMNEYKSIKDYFYGNNIDVFYHYAWDGTAGERRGDYNIQLKNVEYTCDAVKMAKAIGVKKFIFAGSIIEYEYMKCIEQKKECLGINNMYGIGKLTARHMAKILANNINIDFVETTISNIYGPSELSPRLLNITLRKMLNGEKTSFTTCEQLYDFIYINDAVQAFYDIGLKGKKNTNYYIGNKSPRQLKNFIIEMRNIINKDLDLGFGEILFNGISLNYKELDTSILYDELGFKTKISFKEGVERTACWLKAKEGE